MKRWEIGIIFTMILAAGAGLIFLRANASTQSGNVNVGMTVPGAGPVCGNGSCESGETCSNCSADCGSCGGGGPFDTTAPVISDVVAWAGMATATINWTATDDSGPPTCELSYSINELYDSFGAVVRNNDNFSVELSNLASSTPYHFRIYCFDARNNGSNYLGVFSTIGVQARVNITLLGRPEKRVEKPGGNLAASTTLIFYHPLAGQVLGTLDISLDASGVGVAPNALAPSGENLWAILKGEAHLAKKIIGVNIADGQNITLDFTDGGSFYLKAGDTAGDVQAAPGIPNAFVGILSSLRRDDFVDILDISAVVSRFNQTTGFANLNGDGIVDAQDISMVLSNWNLTGDIILE